MERAKTEAVAEAEAKAEVAKRRATTRQHDMVIGYAHHAATCSLQGMFNAVDAQRRNLVPPTWDHRPALSSQRAA